MYTYTVVGQPPCVSLFATVEVTQVPAPNAGANRSLSVCSIDAPFALVERLNGSPQLDGTWVGPNGPHGPSFDPATDTPGLYTYTVAGDPPCANATAALTITVVPAPNAGQSTTTTVCSNEGSFGLLGELGGSPDANGTWTDPDGAVHPGVFIPGSSDAGTYTYTVTGLSPCGPAVATVTVNVTPAPVAGSNASVVLCSNDLPFELTEQLGGTPDTDGAWSGPAGSHGNTFVPGQDTPGTYTYTVTGAVPCADATALLSISIVQAPNAGFSADTTVCANNAPFSLFDRLGGAPAANGTWTGPGNTPSNGIFSPASSVPGTYTYTVPGVGPCADASTTVEVTVIPPPNPGTNGSVSVCSNDAPLELFGLLGGSPDNGGTWTRPNGQPHPGTYLPATEPGGNYTYTVAGNAPCANASAIVQVQRVLAPNAGTDGAITLCSTSSPVNLLTVLGGNPDGTGSWLDPDLQATTSTFTPGSSQPGVYRYVVPGTVPCANDTTLVTVVVNQAPNAGINTSITVCSSDAPFQLADVLDGGPDDGGTWTAPGGGPSDGTFVPGTSVAGGYTYTVAGAAPCLNASAVLVVGVNQQPDAGEDTTLERCSTDPPVDLFTVLGGTPNAGGTWNGPAGSNTGIFVPGTDPEGPYVYAVAGLAPCTNATATVTTSVNLAPNAGVGDTLTICTQGGLVNLFTLLTGNPDAGGTWSDDTPSGTLAGSFVDTNPLVPGSYAFTYTVSGIGPCDADQATVVITIVEGFDAGTSGTLTVCGSSTQVNLFNGLGGTPQQGGVWSDPGGTGALFGQFLNASLLAPGSYSFTYTLSSSASCASASSTVTVTVVAPPNAGSPGFLTVCSLPATSTPLFPSLGGSPQPGGTWRIGSPTGPAFPGAFDPSVLTPGVFFYVVEGTPPCAAVSSTVTVSVAQAPNAGTSSSINVCSTAPQFNMTALLGGNPGPGTWSFNSQPHGPNFVPGLDIAGVYVYTVQGTAPCAPAQASLTVNVEPAPFAGNNCSVTLCSNGPQYLLITCLGGSPQTGGTWLDPSGDPLPGIGVFTPGSSEPGVYAYVVEGNGSGSCANDTAFVTVFVNPEPNAGVSTSINLCSNGSVVDLFTVVGGTPDPGGTWVGPAPGNPPFNGLFVPGVSSPGLYTYTVGGVPPCQPAQATVNVGVSPPSDAGVSASIIICSDETPFSMISRLGGSPSFGGTWTGPLPATTPMDGIFLPGTTAPGTYRYTVPGLGACPNATATLSIVVNQAPNAGNDANLALCSTDGSTALFPLLGPNAQPGGTWTRLSNGTPFSGVVLPSVDVSDTYVYTVTGLPPCGTDVALVSVTINPAPNAGFNNLVTVCDSDPPFVLFNLLNGSPQTLNGSWTGPGGVPSSGIFDPAVSPGGVYTYTVLGTPPCANASATVTVFKNEAPDAGVNAVVEVCSNEPAFELFNALLGTPDPGGTWTGPGNIPSNGFFLPGTSTPGTYTYRIQGLAPCASDSATVTVVQYQAPNAGISTVAQVCSSQNAQPLLGLLGGSPTAGGTWTFNGVPHGNFLNPATASSGTFEYTVVGQGTCGSASAQVQLIVVPAPNAGTSGSIAACIDDPAIPLFTGLGGSPNTGGTWTNNSGAGQLVGSVWDATGVPAGTYIFGYTVAGTAPCASASANVAVSIAAGLDAGEDSTVTACSNQSVDLFVSLAGTPQPGGIWVDVDGSNALLVGGIFNASLVPSGTTWRFDHVLPGTTSCPGDTARVTVQVLVSPFAGCDGVSSQCTTFLQVALATFQACGANGPGQWYAPGGAQHPGMFQPATDPAGVYYFVVDGVGDCPADTAFVTVNLAQPSNAGTSVTVSICSNGAPVDLFPALGPNAQPGGSWQCLTCLGQPSFPGIYNPVMHVPGAYQYSVPSPAPCPNDTAVVTVLEPVAPNAGCNNILQICSDQAPLDLRLNLGCFPDLGGTWTGPDGPHGDFFDPANDTPGVYTYTVAGTAPCADASATLTINVTNQGNPGVSATTTACLNQGSINLFPLLGPTATAGGTWSGTGVLPSGFFNPAQTGTGTFICTYAFPSNGPCAAVSRTVTVTVIQGLSAGQAASVEVCGAETAFNLFQALGGSPDPGGTWQDLIGTGGLLPGGILNATLVGADVTGQYGYTVVDPLCGEVTAVVTVTVRPFPDPGTGAALILCATDQAVDLFGLLGGTPMAGGTWTGPSGAAHGDSFDPASDAAGPYRYTVQGNLACPDSAATVSITVNAPPNAGLDGVLTVCDTLTALDLLTGLLGTPQTGGTWTDLDGAGSLTGGSLNTTPLNAGSYRFRYTVDVPACGSASAEVEVTVRGSVEVNDLVTNCNTVDRTYTVSFSVHGGDAGSVQVEGLAGTLLAGASMDFTSVPIPTSEAFVAFVRDQFGCNEVRVEGLSPCTFDDEVFIPQSFSPNGDGINDSFVIPGIEGYPDNEITIFNRWGAKMYAARGYDNRSVVWDGTSPEGLYSGVAPSGTYFYILDIGNGRAPFTGYIYLNR